MKNVTKTICAAVFTITAGMSGMAMADSYNETVVTTSAEGFRTTTVSYADLDLNNTDAREILHFRISHAAEKVCGSVNRNLAGSLAQAGKNRSCHNNAMDEAMHSISNGQIAVVSR
jgi:UrcA family protein